jgi:hypothetical protein
MGRLPIRALLYSIPVQYGVHWPRGIFALSVRWSNPESIYCWRNFSSNLNLLQRLQSVIYTRKENPSALGTCSAATLVDANQPPVQVAPLTDRSRVFCPNGSAAMGPISLVNQQAPATAISAVEAAISCIPACEFPGCHNIIASPVAVSACFRSPACFSDAVMFFAMKPTLNTP